MKRLFIGSLVILAGCAGPAPSTITPSGPPPVRAPSVYGLLGERERLDLTSAQVEALDSIGRWLAAETDEIEDELAPPERAGRVQPDSAEAATFRDAVTAAHVHAIEGVEALLTAEQREVVCEIQREERDERRESRGDRARPAPFGAGRAMAPARARWTWCPEEQETPPAS